jgi:hypothetical protein
MTFSKRYLESKSIHWNWRYHQFNVKKRVKLDEKASVDFSRFHTFFDIKLMISPVPVHSVSNASFAVKIDLCSCRELFIRYFISY